MMFVSGIASLNLPNLLVRFLPEGGSRTQWLIAWSYAVAVMVAAASVAVFLIGVGAWAPRLSFLRSQTDLQVWFILSTLAWCVFVLQDSVLTALGRAVWVPIENAVFSLLKLALLAALVTALPRYGIFVSWTAAMLVSVVGVNLLIFARLAGPASQRPVREVLTLRDRAFVRYFAADYVCSIAWISAVNLMPIVVTSVAGATVNAYYALAWAVALPMYVFAASIGISLVLHGTHDPAALSELTRKAARQGAAVLLPGVALIVAFAPIVLSLFGPAYEREGTTLLRLLCLGALPYFVLALSVSVARVHRHMRPATIALVAQAVLTLGLTAPLIHAAGVTGAGIAWLTSQCVVAAGLLAARRS
jgi:O-antigen/teichoic acid export membrane protein